MKKGAPKSQRVKRRKSKTISGGLLQVNAKASAAPAGLAMPPVVAIVVTGLCVLVIAWGMWLGVGWLGRLLFTENDRFNLQRVEARTDGVISESLFVAWSGVTLNENLFQISLNDVRVELESHPIVRRAVVRRKLPDSLEIIINERVPIARMGQVDGNMSWLVDAEGFLIRKSVRDQHLPLLLGTPDDATLGDNISDKWNTGAALELLARLREMPALKRELFEVLQVHVRHPDFLEFRLRNGIKVLLPVEGDARTRLERATRILDENQRLDPPRSEISILPSGPNHIGAN